MLEGVPPAAIVSLQGVGYLPVEIAFTLGLATPDTSRCNLYGVTLYPFHSSPGGRPKTRLH